MANITTGSYVESLFFYTYMPIGIFFFVNDYRYRPKYEIASLRDALMGLIPIPTLRKSEIFLYGVIEIKPLRGFFGAMRIVIFSYFWGVPNNNHLPCPIHAFSTPTNE